MRHSKLFNGGTVVLRKATEEQFDSFKDNLYDDSKCQPSILRTNDHTCPDIQLTTLTEEPWRLEEVSGLLLPRVCAP